jgi:hypothetical protein
MRELKPFIKQDGLLFRSKRGGPLVENSILIQGNLEASFPTNTSRALKS